MVRTSILFTSLVFMALLTGPSAGTKDDWPQFRGRMAGVAADDPALPDTWSATDHVAWKINLSRGWS
jgi:hypothetical protein